MGVSASFCPSPLYTITHTYEYAKADVNAIAQENIHSSQLAPTYVSNGRLGPNNVSLNGWTPNSKETVGKSHKEMYPLASAQGKQIYSNPR